VGSASLLPIPGGAGRSPGAAGSNEKGRAAILRPAGQEKTNKDEILKHQKIRVSHGLQ
jgi:hypothetical protein